MSDSPDETPTFADLAADPEIAALLDFEPVVRKVKRRDGWTPELQRELIARLAWTGNLPDAAAQMGRDKTGAAALYRVPGAESFRLSWDAALAIGLRRRGYGAAPFAGEVPGMTRPPHPDPLPQWGEGGVEAGPGDDGQVLNEYGEWEDEASFEQRAEEAHGSIAGKLLAARRLYLQEISSSPGKRAAFEILTDFDVDWDKAAALEPQDDEPYAIPNMREPDMVLTAESGWSFGDIGYGPDRKAELRQAIDAQRASEGLPAVQWGESE